MTPVVALLADLNRLGIQLVARGDGLWCRPRSAVTPDLAERLKAHQRELLAILGASGARDGAAGPDGWPAESVEPPLPCPGCGALVSWWNPLGDRRCMVCDAPRTAIKALESVARIRRRHRIPISIDAEKMLAKLKRLIGT